MMTRLLRLSFLIFICLLAVSSAYSGRPQQPAYTDKIGGYALLFDCDINNNPYAMVSDGEDIYVDLSINKTSGDRIEFVSYKDYDNYKEPRYLRCFIGKPELDWRSDRRVRFNFDITSGTTEGTDYQSNQKVADMLTYNVTLFPNVRRGNPQMDESYYLNDDTVHITIQKDWYPTVKGTWIDEERAYFLVDRTDVAEDPEAITDTHLHSIDLKAPYYWTAIDASTVEKDPHDQILFMLYDQGLNFTALDFDNKEGYPITWEITPKSGPVQLCVNRKIRGNSYEWKVLRIFDSGIPFRLIVSRDYDELFTHQAPPKPDKSTIAWGAIKIK